MSNATRILIALVLGISLGIGIATLDPTAAGSAANIAEPIGTMWLNALRMTIIPLVVSLLVTGIARTAEAARAGKIAGRALALILTLMTCSAIFGAVMTPTLLNLFPLPQESAAALRAALTSATPVNAPPPFGDFLRALIPTNPIAAAVNNDILPLMIFTGTFAFALTRLPPTPRATLADFFSALAEAMIVVIGWVLKIAPIGVAALAFVVGARSGAAAFGAVLHYVLIVSSVGFLIALIAYPFAVFGGRVRLRDYAREIAPVQALAVSTQSSLACLPLMLVKSERLGAAEATAGVVLPMAIALLRATGPAMNLAVALYVANWYGIELTTGQYAIAVLAATLTSLGAVSLPGNVSFVTSIAPICLTLGIPVEPLALLIAVETLPDIFRTLGNAMFDVSATVTVARRTGTMEDRDAVPYTGIGST